MVNKNDNLKSSSYANETIEAEPVKNGRRLPHKITASSICSLCRRVFADETPYCPNCGAKMDLKKGESE